LHHFLIIGNYKDMPYSSEDYERAALLDQQRQQEMREQDQNRQREGKTDDQNRQQSGTIHNATDIGKNLAKAATPMGFFSVLKKIDFLKDMPFFCAFGFAILKDILDLVFAETVILSILFSILCSTKSIVKKIIPLIGGGILDSIPGLDFLPIETVTVGVIYYMTLAER
jgi:hypothetical protein